MPTKIKIGSWDAEITNSDKNKKKELELVQVCIDNPKMTCSPDYKNRTLASF